MDTNKLIKHLREDFTKDTLVAKDLNPDPVLQFDKWLKEALKAEVDEPLACTISTVNEQMQPSSRIVYLRELHQSSFIFYTNYTSSKGQDLAKNNRASLNFFWPELQRQVQIHGTVEKTSAEVSDTYFNQRPRESKLGAWASDQSSVLESREALIKRLDDLKVKFENKDIPRPDFWGGYALKPSSLEFWQGRSSRLHDRFRYRKKNGNWNLERLNP